MDVPMAWMDTRIEVVVEDCIPECCSRRGDYFHPCLPRV